MMPPAMDSLDVVEMVMAIEEVFAIDLPDAGAEVFSSPDVVDWLDVRLSNQRPNETAQALLRKLAHDQQRPELAEDLNGLWQREQIAAIVQRVFR